MTEQTIETRVGHATTSFLEQETKKYIELNTIEGKYIGDPKYIQIYNNLRNYNTK